MARTSSSNKAPNADTATTPSLDPYQEIAALVRTTRSRDELLIQAFRSLAKCLGSPYGGIHVSDGSAVFDETYHSGPTDPDFWRRSVDRFLTDSLTKGTAQAKLFNPKRGTVKVAFVSAPIVDASGTPVGALALVLEQIDKADLMRQLAMVESVARYMSFAADFAGTDQADGETSARSDPNRALSQAASFSTPEELAFAITNNLRTKLGCEEVALGMVEANRVRILSVSGLDNVVVRSEGVRHLRSAMEECLDTDQPIVCQRGDSWSASDPGAPKLNYRLHRQWQVAAKGDGVASIPLHDKSTVVAVLSFRRRAEDAISTEIIDEIRAHVEPFAPALLLTKNASRTMWRHAVDSVRDFKSLLTNPGNVTKKVMIAVAILIAGWFFLGSVNYEYTVPCTIVASDSRHTTVPFDSVLRSVHVTEGDRVHRGQLLCRMDAREMEALRAELIAKIAVLEREKDRALAEDSPIDFQLGQANQRLARTRLARAESRIERANVVAPIDGVIMSGDLRQAVGAVLVKGETLFEVAPLGSCILELHIPERDIDEISPNMEGVFSVHARPEQAFPIRIARIRPRAEVLDEKNVYVAEANGELDLEWMRPGMGGFAKVRVGRRRVYWAAFHRAIDYLRMTLWL